MQSSVMQIFFERINGTNHFNDVLFLLWSSVFNSFSLVVRCMRKARSSNHRESFLIVEVNHLCPEETPQLLEEALGT
jgi:hypothetical protein